MPSRLQLGAFFIEALCSVLLFWICKCIFNLVKKIIYTFGLFAGEDAQEGDQVPNLSLKDNYSESLPIYREQTKNMYNETFFNSIENQNSLGSSIGRTENMVSVKPIENTVFPPPPPSYFMGYTLPPGHPCNSFTLPPPSADKKRTGPRRKFLLCSLL